MTPGSERSRKPGRLLSSKSGALPGAMTLAMTEPSAEDRYIVLLKDGTSSAMQATTEIASPDSGITPTHVYEHVFNGFAAVIPKEKLDAVQQDKQRAGRGAGCGRGTRPRRP